jgi:uncharacterized damage-inducible protein DinB
MNHPYARLASYKHWADRLTYEQAGAALHRLEARDQDLLLQVLDHVCAVDTIFQCHLQGRPHGFKAARSEKVPAFDELADRALAASEWYVTYADAMGESDLQEEVAFSFTSGTAARWRRADMLLHVYLHGQYHRGNAGALLQLRGLTPARDGFSDFLLGGGRACTSAQPLRTQPR